MGPYVLKNRGSDHSWASMAMFFVAIAVTVLASTWLICVFLEMVPAAFSKSRKLADAFDVNRWLFGIVFVAVCYGVAKGREFSLFRELRKLDADGIMCYLGAERVLRDSADPYLRRIINVNEEIAIAARRAPAQLYWLDGEMGINHSRPGSNSPRHPSA